MSYRDNFTFPLEEINNVEESWFHAVSHDRHTLGSRVRNLNTACQFLCVKVLRSVGCLLRVEKICFVTISSELSVQIRNLKPEVIIF
jgi:hypothetical protein